MSAHVLEFDPEGYIPEIEQNILGALMIGTRGQEALGILRDYHFIAPAHRAIFAAIQAGYERYSSSNPSIVFKLLPPDTLEDLEKSVGVGMSSYLARLAANTTSASGNATSIAKSVIQQWARLSLVSECGHILAAANDPSADPVAVGQSAAKMIDDIMSETRSGSSRQSRVSIGGAAGRALDSAMAARSNGTGLTGVTWGLPDLNRLTGGIQRRDLTLIGARPSMGKSTIAFSVALHAAKAGHTCGIVSLEMDAEKVAARAVSDFLFERNIQIPYVDIIRGNVTDSQLDSIAEAHIDIDRLPLMIDDQPGQTVTDIRVRAERMAEDCRGAGKSLDVLFVDHLGLIRPSSRYSGNRVNEIAEITSGLKSLARELDIAVVLLSQLNRSVESREEKRPQLSDLRDSGAIEQDADMIAFLFRESYYLEREKGGGMDADMARADRLAEAQNKLEFIIAKQRNGPLGTINLFADMAYSAVRAGAKV